MVVDDLINTINQIKKSCIYINFLYDNRFHIVFKCTWNIGPYKLTYWPDVNKFKYIEILKS